MLILHALASRKIFDRHDIGETSVEGMLPH